MAAPGAVSERPELRELVSALSGVSWDNLKLVTLQLNVPNHIAEDTEATHPTNVSSRKIHVLNSWLQMDVTASWENVVAALRSCGLAAEAERIAGQYLPNLVDSSTTTSSSPTNYSDYGGLPTAETVSRMHGRPTLAQLQRLKVSGRQDVRVIEQVAVKWDDVAVAMDFDPVGHTQTAINRDFGTVQEKCTETFKRWLQGVGSKQPPTWAVLVEILRDCDFEHIATGIEAAFH